MSATATVSSLDNDIASPAHVAPITLGDRAIACLLFLGQIALLWSSRTYSILAPDEGMTIHAGERVLAGQVPYRDFFSFVTPGSPYLLAWQFRLFGHSLLVPRFALLVYAGVFGALTYLLARRIYEQKSSLLAAYLVAPATACLFVNHNWDSTVSALLGIFAAHAFLHSRSRTWAFLLGAAVTVTILFAQSRGGGLLFGLALAVVALTFTRRSIHWLRLSHVLSFFTGVALPAIATGVYFARQHALRAMLKCILWPVGHYGNVNRVPYAYFMEEAQPGTTWGDRIWQLFMDCLFLSPAVLVLAVVLMTAFWVWLGRRRTHSIEVLDHQILGGCMFFGIWVSVIATRADIIHLIFILPLFAYLVPGILDLQEFQTARIQALRKPIALSLIFTFFLFCGAPLSRRGVPLNTPFGQITASKENAHTASLLQSKLAPGDHLYVHPYQPYFYSLTGADNPTSFDWIFPAMFTPEQYQQLIEELRRDRTPFVVLEGGFYQSIPGRWPATRAIPKILATDPVADYITANYRVCNLLGGGYWFMTRKDLTCPR